MEKPKFRPGPWVAIEVQQRLAPFSLKPIFSHGLWFICEECNSEKLPVAVLDSADDHDQETREVVAAGTARLIAATPGMYDALIAADAEEAHYVACDYCDGIWCDTMAELHKRTVALRCAALAKANGR